MIEVCRIPYSLKRKREIGKHHLLPTWHLPLGFMIHKDQTSTPRVQNHSLPLHSQKILKAQKKSHPVPAAVIGLLVCDPQAVTPINCAQSVLASLYLGCNIPGLMAGQLIR